MSFSSELKSELLTVMPKSIHCRIAELAGIISISGRAGSPDSDDSLIIRVESDEMEEKVIRLLKHVAGISDESIIRQNQKKHHRKIIIENPESVHELRQKCKLVDMNGRFYINEIVTERSCCKQSYIRGAFLAGGSVTSPEKANQLEIVTLSKQEADRMVGDFSVLGMTAKTVERRDRFIVYIKDGNTISNLIGVMGAPMSLMEYENFRIVKDIRNSINREVNCDAANMAKTAGAATRQLEDIKYIRSRIGLEALPDGLREMAEIRIANPYLPLKELGAFFVPPLGKSGISHRLHRLSEMAEELRNKEKS